MNNGFFQMLSVAHFPSIESRMKSQWELPQEAQSEPPPLHIRFLARLRKAVRKVGITLMYVGGKLVALGTKYSDAYEQERIYKWTTRRIY